LLDPPQEKRKMSKYNLEDLSEKGAPIAFAMLLRSIKTGEPFITYGAIKKELESQLGIETIFTIHIGHVAGTVMNELLRVDAKAPLINVMITQATGIPGDGAGGYLAERYGQPKLRKWKKIPREKKVEIVAAEREKIFSYKRWDSIGRKAFGGLAQLLPVEEPNESSGTTGFGSCPESDEHKALKTWVSKNPSAIGLEDGLVSGRMEVRLASGDEVDVVFSAGTSFRVVEVKSIRSNDEDLKRGIYQCIKYREVRRAEHLPFEVDVEAILVTERQLSPYLNERARILGVRVVTVSVNRPKRKSANRARE
jgi:hypothetical protein